MSRGRGRVPRRRRRGARARFVTGSPSSRGLPAGAGPVWTGGFAFAADGGIGADLGVASPGLVVLPGAPRSPSGEAAYLTASWSSSRGRTPSIAARAAAGAARLAARPSPLTPADPHPGGPADRRPPPPGALRAGVAAAVERNRAGELDKVVLARELTVEAPAGARSRRPCSGPCASSSRPASASASERRGGVRRRQPRAPGPPVGRVAGTVALAGTTRRSADPAVDDHLGEAMLHSAKVREEHEIVVRRIERRSAARGLGRGRARAVVVKVGNIQHLATPIRAQLAEARSAIELAGPCTRPPPSAGSRATAASS